MNLAPDYISKEEIEEIAKIGVTYEYAFSVILAAAFELDIIDDPSHKELFNNYFTKMIHHLDISEYTNNPYYKNIKIPKAKIGKSELKYEKFKPFEGFVCNDIVVTKEGRQIPQIGFFDQEFYFPAMLENKRIWMTITPNEIETMKEPIQKSSGHVLTYGLGLGYYAYMVSEKEQVNSVTVVEKNEVLFNYLKNTSCPNSIILKKIRSLKEMLLNTLKKRCQKKTLISFLQAFGTMLLMVSKCI